MDKISKAQLKLVRSLQQKKYRDELGLFVAEGEKCVEELRKSFELEYLIVEDGLTATRSYSANGLIAKRSELEQMSSLRTPQGVIGVFKKPPEICNHQSSIINLQSSISLALDGIQDPGNLGTIIRTCDWFGVHDIFCSRDTADCFNPKVVQATMGALARVRVHCVDLPAWLEGVKKQESGLKTPIYGTLLDGKNMYEVLQSEGRSNSDSGLTAQRSIIVMGNEGNGISQAVRQLITHPLFIPSYPKNAETSESLNVSIATAIILSEFRRPAKNQF